MSQLKALDQDAQFFADHPDRQARIRLPGRGPAINAQRAVRIQDEMAGEFFSLGEHDKSRRRIIIWRVPKDNPQFNPKAPQLLKLPFLAFADEEIADRDDILLPIVREIKQDAAKKFGIR